jgi:Xaa-Pro dipeptidase
MRDQAKPITNDERRARIEKAKRLMTEQKIGALILTGGTSLTYFAGMRWGGGERLFACVIPVKGEPFFVCPAFEEDRAREQIAVGPFGPDHADVRTWNEDESPYALVARGLKDRGLGSATIGIEETTKLVWSEGIASAAPQSKVVLGTAITAGCRMIKDDSRRHHHHGRRRLHGRRLPIRHHPHVRPRLGDSKDEQGLRHREARAERSVESREARRAARID